MTKSLTPKDLNFEFSKLNPTHQSLKKCKAYLSQYFVPLKDGNHAVFEDG